MLERFQVYINRYHLIAEGEKVILALSGGIESMVLADLLLKAKVEFVAAHCNFHLRGEESDRDEAFCAVLCEKENSPFHRVHFDTRQYAILHKVSIEMAARELRYRYFEQLRHDIDAAEYLEYGNQTDDHQIKGRR